MIPIVASVVACVVGVILIANSLRPSFYRDWIGAAGFSFIAGMILSISGAALSGVFLARYFGT